MSWPQFCSQFHSSRIMLHVNINTSNRWNGKDLTKSLPHNLTMTNIFEVLEVQVANKQGIKRLVPKKLIDSITIRFSIDMY